MEQMIRDITMRLTGRLPEDREFYTPEDLQVLDIPEFVTERVVIEMNQNLNESLVPPDTEWANMDSPAVQFAWKNFIEAIKAEVMMPASYSKSIFEAAVADTMDLALRPRRAIPDSLFGADTELTISQVKKRIRYITVGRQLAAALVRYMEKKNKSAISLNECREIVTKVDEKLIKGHNSLDWAKETEPLFLLAGPKVDTEFLRIYFQDKGLPKLADKFDRIDQPVNRTEFIEVLSAPDPVEKEEQQAGEVTDSEAKSPEGKKAKDSEKAASDLPKKRKGQSGELYIPDDSILGSFQMRRGEGEQAEDFEKETESQPSSSDYGDAPSDEIEDSESKPLHERFVFDEEAADETPPRDTEEPETIYDEMNFKKESSEHDDLDEPRQSSIPQFDPELLRKWKTIGGLSEEEDEPILEETDKPDDDDEPVASIELYNETDDEEDVPMWRAFLEREDLSKIREEEEEEEETLQESQPAERFYAENAAYSDLDKWLEPERKRIIDEIFGGSKNEYEAAISGLSSKKDWKSAAGYLEKEVFKKNNINLLDEAAVGFTDRLQSYYTKRKG
ncbi:hypothetical protein [Rhodohalobacter mucosus]|uniref:Uncharacterized protein n=1 Tax=Rhodohalobacter mucosus TaxID=2079485 RepID=A0A316TW99_9BACT|nr:hypothetical protein [Rhodohalobacter mucosus]PWN08131.1 hypothetical protein DDZ15_00405 [Rhodohalobacter mucosus]